MDDQSGFGSGESFTDRGHGWGLSCQQPRVANGLGEHTKTSNPTA